MKHLKYIIVGIFFMLTIGQTANLFAQDSKAPRTYVPPQELYRFKKSNQTHGYLLSPDYTGSINNGYTYSGLVGSIYVSPTPTATPDSMYQTVPLYQWTVVQNGKTYFYYATQLYSLGGNYTYNGIIGYVFDSLTYSFTNPESQIPFSAPTDGVSSWYNQTHGYWYGWQLANGGIGSNGYNYELPPTGSTSFWFQASVFRDFYVDQPSGFRCGTRPGAFPPVIYNPGNPNQQGVCFYQNTATGNHVRFNL